jgi:DNA repair protein RadC
MRTVKTKSKGIASWPIEEQPRERLMSLGPQALTDAELIAILIRVGFKGTNAVELARQLLKQFGSLRFLVETPALALLEIKGLKRINTFLMSEKIETYENMDVPM